MKLFVAVLVGMAGVLLLLAGGSGSADQLWQSVFGRAPGKKGGNQPDQATINRILPILTNGTGATPSLPPYGQNPLPGYPGGLAIPGLPAPTAGGVH